ncbi:hypothetical protein K933_02056 [Candidatus Halobonum tyrrellensis G22]|uniref:Uncharacterized protein n=1 Tax=Candidatus Halobonum tyrrellensis G22 TaxID=1324957 RepID=V4J2V7_9EURY|nr:hypothetical protein K933_02056 [Candidatus Halobonum tyrrellensis G22]
MLFAPIALLCQVEYFQEFGCVSRWVSGNRFETSKSFFERLTCIRPFVGCLEDVAEVEAILRIDVVA